MTSLEREPKLSLFVYFLKTWSFFRMFTPIKRPANAFLSSLFTATCLTPIALFAADESPKALTKMVVTSSLTPTPAAQVGSAVTVITAEDIARQQITYVADILRP
jgi:outer membrane receptor for ferrienterochelin and colicin